MLKRINTYNRENVSMKDITPAEVGSILSKVCLYQGHTKHYCSMAEYAVYLAGMFPIEMQLYPLFHDAPNSIGINTEEEMKYFIESMGLNFRKMIELSPQILEMKKQIDIHAEMILLKGQEVLVREDHPLANAIFSMSPEQAEIYFNDVYKFLVG